MKIDKVIIVWENLEKEINDYGMLKVLRVEFNNKEENPIVYIDAGVLKIEDRSLKLDSKDILNKFAKLDFDYFNKVDKYTEGFSKNSWKLIINEKEYSGVFSEPGFLKESKKVVRFDSFLDYANKKIAKYFK